MFSWVGALISHDNLNGYRCGISCSRYNFPALNVTDLVFPFVVGYTPLMFPTFYFALFCSFHFMTTISPTLFSGYLLLYFKLYSLPNNTRYSFPHLFRAASLHLLVYFSLIRKYLFSRSVRCLLEIGDVWTRTSKFGVKTGKLVSLSM